MFEEISWTPRWFGTTQIWISRWKLCRFFLLKSAACCLVFVFISSPSFSSHLSTDWMFPLPLCSALWTWAAYCWGYTHCPAFLGFPVQPLFSKQPLAYLSPSAQTTWRGAVWHQHLLKLCSLSSFRINVGSKVEIFNVFALFFSFNNGLIKSLV